MTAFQIGLWSLEVLSLIKWIFLTILKLNNAYSLYSSVNNSSLLKILKLD